MLTDRGSLENHRLCDDGEWLRSSFGRTEAIARFAAKWTDLTTGHDHVRVVVDQQDHPLGMCMEESTEKRIKRAMVTEGIWEDTKDLNRTIGMVFHSVARHH
jgi:hypothetical protein